jgi:putative tryptophan/tyrosine transport system substrate-binding protein
MFLQDLQDLSYVEGRDLQMTYRSSDGHQDRLPALAEGLVRLNPDVLVAAGLDAVVALRNVTQTIPIVSATLADAVHLGLIANEARPHRSFRSEKRTDACICLFRGEPGRRSAAKLLNEA